MKKILVILIMVLVVSSLEAKIGKRYGRSMLQVEPRASFYINDAATGETVFGLACDFIFNPFPSLGFRIGLTELRFNGGTVFSMNYGSPALLPSIDGLFYISMRGVQPFVHAGLGLVTREGFTLLAVGGGMGFDYFLNRSTAFSIEPGIYIVNQSNGESDTEVVFRLTVGVKFDL